MPKTKKQKRLEAADRLLKYADKIESGEAFGYFEGVNDLLLKTYADQRRAEAARLRELAR